MLFYCVRKVISEFHLGTFFSGLGKSVCFRPVVVLLKHLGLLKLMVVYFDTSIARGRQPHFSDFVGKKQSLLCWLAL